MRKSTMPSISFSSNWNGKLSCDVFPTFRVFNPELHRIGAEFDIILNDKWLKRATLVYTLVCDFSEMDIPDTLTFLDTGYGTPEFMEMIRTMYKNKLKPEDHQWVFLILKTWKNKAIKTEANPGFPLNRTITEGQSPEEFDRSTAHLAPD